MADEIYSAAPTVAATTVPAPPPSSPRGSAADHLQISGGQQIRDSDEILADEDKKSHGEGALGFLGGLFKSAAHALGLSDGGSERKGKGDAQSDALQKLIAKRAAGRASYEERNTIAEMTGVTPAESIGPFYSNGMRNPNWKATAEAAPNG